MKRANTVNVNANVMNTLVGSIANCRLAQKWAALVSAIMGEKVSNLKAMHLLNAMCSVWGALLFGGFSTLAQVLLLVWAAAAVWQCKKDGWADFPIHNA